MQKSEPKADMNPNIYGTAAQIPVASSPRRLNFCTLGLLSMELAFRRLEF